MSYVVIIPVYQRHPSNEERISLLQSFRILRKYDILLCCPYSLDTTEYNSIVGEEIRVERFPDNFFRSIDGYNELMTSCEFYIRFARYEYMLIYQLDAYVFSDQLEEWCQKGYDYVGAPWFKEHKDHTENSDDLWTCGNGGFSLRKIDKFIKITSPKTRCYSTKYIITHFLCSYKTIWKGLVRLLGIKNNMTYYRRKNSFLWEDAYFCYGLNNTSQSLYLPPPEQAALFSFERSPKYLYELTGHKLPFGCHAWKKYQYNDFWKEFIPVTQ